VLAFAVSLAWVVRHAWVTDDIFITFRYCDNVLAGQGPVYNPGEHSEGYTHFLWFVLLTVGRALGIEAHLLGKYLALPAFIGCLGLLVFLSARLFPGRGGLWGVPLAALAWAAHEDARLFASGGLETAFFVFLLLLGFAFLAAASHPRRFALAGWAYALATLVRPDGLLFSGLAGAWVLWQAAPRWRRLREFSLVWVALVVPHFVFRLAYYHYPLPNPYYAKSGALANWPQGWAYLGTYFACYFVLLLAVPALVLLGLRLLRRPVASHPLQAATTPLALAGAGALASIFYVTRVGGDFMFARFYLPATPFLLLLCEWLVHQLPWRGWRLAAAIACVGLVLYGGFRKRIWFSEKRHVRGIVDEPQYYPDARLAELRGWARVLQDCLAGTGAVVMVQGGQAALAYYAHFPVAVERYGLTDVHIAHTPTPPIRGRPGHEKVADVRYIFARHVNLRIHYRPVRSLPVYAQFGIESPVGIVYGEIIYYDRPLMERLKRCPGVRFLDFPIWLEHDYIPTIDTRLPRRVAQDFNEFKRFYFDHNPDPEGLQARLEREMAARGIQRLPPEELQPDFFKDTGQPTAPPGG
jgi:hypothetical protein